MKNFLFSFLMLLSISVVSQTLHFEKVGMRDTLHFSDIPIKDSLAFIIFIPLKDSSRVTKYIVENIVSQSRTGVEFFFYYQKRTNNPNDDLMFDATQISTDRYFTVENGELKDLFLNQCFRDKVQAYGEMILAIIKERNK
ncbi:MAG: hypothetical protein ABH951_02060 [Patescibacteria group bacterium]